MHQLGIFRTKSVNVIVLVAIVAGIKQLGFVEAVTIEQLTQAADMMRSSCIRKTKISDGVYQIYLNLIK